MKRTQEEIIKRHKGYDFENDPIGFCRQVLEQFMTPESRSEIFNVHWVAPEDPMDLDDYAEWYFNFALDKALSHRGNSAVRSVGKLREIAWLMKREDAIAAMDAAEYKQYGMPKLQAFAKALDSTWVETETIRRMANGEPCKDNCQEGCSLD